MLFRSEVPSEKQLQDWLDLVGPKVKQSHGAILRNEVPASLVGLKAQAEEDLTGYRVCSKLRPERVRPEGSPHAALGGRGCLPPPFGNRPSCRLFPISTPVVMP